TTKYERNNNGQLRRIIGPDPDGAGPLTSPETHISYDSKGNVVLIVHPDASFEAWMYDSAFNVPTSYIDSNGNTTLYTLDENTGAVLSLRKVVGRVDGEDGNTEDDDILYTYMYTGLPANSGDPPAGLLASETNPLGVTTEYAYNARGLVIEITYAVGTND